MRKTGLLLFVFVLYLTSVMSFKFNTAESSLRRLSAVERTTPPKGRLVLDPTTQPRPDPSFPPHTMKREPANASFLEYHRRRLSTVPYEFISHEKPIYGWHDHTTEHCRELSWGTLCEGCCYDRHDEHECGISDCSDTSTCTSTTSDAYQYSGFDNTQPFHQLEYWNWNYRSAGSTSCVPNVCANTLTNELPRNFPASQYDTITPDTSSTMYFDKFCYSFEYWWYVV